MHERIGFLPLISPLLLPLLLAPLACAEERDAPRHSRGPLAAGATRCPHNAYANRIELPEP